MTTILCGAGRSIFTKICTKEKSLYDKTKINSIIFLFGFFTVLCIGSTSLETIFQVPWWLTVVYAVCMVLAQVFLMLAFELGPVSISSLIYNSSFIIATIFGCVYYQEKISFLHIIGILLILSSFALSIKSEDKQGGIRWFCMSLLGFCFGGSMGIWQKILRVEYPSVKLDNFMQVSFLMMFAFSIVIVLISRLFVKRQSGIGIITQPNTKTIQWKTFGCVVAIGAIMGLMNKINTFLVGVLPSIVVFPAINGGGIVATSLLSIIIFKEKTTIRQKLALVIGIVGIVTVALGSLFV